MRTINKYIQIVIIFCLPSWSYAQTASQVAELNQIKSDIDKSMQSLAKNYAQMQVYNFFGGRFGFVHQANQNCINIFKSISSQASQLKNPEMLSVRYSTPAEAFAALNVVTGNMLNDRSTLRSISALGSEFNLQKEQLKDTEKFLTFSDDQIVRQFQRPDDLDKDYGYKSYLIKTYREISTRYSDKMKLYASKCAGANLNVESLIQKRNDFFYDFAKKLSEYYVENATEEFLHNLKALSKPSEDTNLLLNIDSVFARLDRKYRELALYEKDYLQSIQIIDSYESIAFILLTRILPTSLNAEKRTQAEIEIKARVQKAKDYKKILDQQKPSEWLKQRYDLVSLRIKNNKIPCDQKCKVILTKVEEIIEAAKVMEIVTTDSIYIALGYQALDSIR